MSDKKAPRIPLPKSWSQHVRSAMLHVISLAQFATVYTRSWAVDSLNGRVRLKAEKDRQGQEIALLREEIRIKDARMTQINPHRRPHYPPTERMAILELRAARGWSLEQAGDTFLLTAPTVASWMKRIDEQGPDALVQLREPVNKFPDFVRYVVQRLKTLCPSMGKVKIAQTLCRASLHLGATTIGRILKEPPQPTPKEPSVSTGRVVTAKEPNHVWHVDLTTVPTGSGLWTSWLPFALPQSWPFCCWVAVVIDHFSRRIINVGVFANRPDCRAVCVCLGWTVRRANTPPKYIICDRDSIFDCAAFRRWVKRQGVQPPRYGAVGKHGSIAVVERLIRSLKDECTRRTLLPPKREACRRELLSFIDWYNEHRPHTTLDGQTPNEVYFGQRPAHRRPRIEPRKRWPRASRCARPQTLVAGKPGDRFTIDVGYHRGRKYLPIVSLKRAA
ncbi:MAG: integrase core domain-containing protein [SAR202 cluster bacterium]|nr:integrase core domain-containing protein [SAR202 cluster bacterium]